MSDSLAGIRALMKALPTILPNEKILTGKRDGYDAACVRWSQINYKSSVPYVIVFPATAAEIVKLIKAARKNDIPFVPCTGRNTSWSMIAEGMVIDLSEYKGLSVEPEQGQVTVEGAVLMEELQHRLAEKGQFTAVASTSTIGVIPFMIAGGYSSYMPLIGYASENILSAEMILADGAVVTATESQHADLLWAIRGAGQFFGIVTKLVIRTYPLSLIGPRGERQMGTMIFPADRAEQVCQALKDILAAAAAANNNNGHVSSGHLSVVKNMRVGENNVEHGHYLLLAPEFFGTLAQLKQTFKPVLDLGPVVQDYESQPFEKHGEQNKWLGEKGNHKRLSQIALREIDPKKFARVVRLHEKLLMMVPDAGRSMFSIRWHTPARTDIVARKTETCLGLTGVDLWFDILSYYTDAALHSKVLQFDQRAQDIIRHGCKPEESVSYTATNRDDPPEWRYPDPVALDLLRKLKRRYDPEGVFTRLLL
ncbi:MAG: hypothetical protein Q9191_005687 [Dirinaria sp. TL-2023a]